MLGGGADAPAFEQRRHVVNAHGLAAAPRGGKRRIAAAGSDVKDAPAGLQVGGFHKEFGLENDARANDRKIAAGPSGLLALFDGGEVDGCGSKNLSHVWFSKKVR
ncbi:MAG: hypothetical protein BroJett014_07440 [Planctomycetota bacterium]|nr:MAG: hypothetical protein BroJett014_07440 [Planctomycetota bacterium]